MKKVILLALVLVSSSTFSQSDDFSNVVLDRTNNSPAFKGFSLGFLVQGQTKYPSPFYGPEVNGLFNNGAYHFIVDFYYKKILIGFQLTDEYLYLKKVDSSGAIWKPRGFNGNFSSLTRAYWVSLGYNVYKDLNLKLSVGFRNGPTNSILMNNKLASEVTEGYGYYEPSNVINQSENLLDNYSEIDFSASINYPIKLYKNYGIVPELGYSFKHGGIITGLSIIFLNKEKYESSSSFLDKKNGFYNE